MVGANSPAFFYLSFPSPMKKLLLVFFILIQTWAQAQIVDSLKQELSKNPSNLNVLNQLAVEYTHSYMDSSLYFSHQVISIAEQLQDTTSLARAYFTKGIALQKKGAYQKSKEAFLISLSYSKKKNLIELQVSALNSLGILFDILGKRDSAFFFFELCVVKLKKIDNQETEASVHFNMGGLYVSIGNYAQALTKYFESLTIREKYKDLRRMAICMEAIASVYEKQKKYELAYSYYKQAQKRLSIKEHSFNLGILYCNLANLFIHTKKIDSADAYIGKASELATTIKDEEGLAYTLILQAEVEIQRQDLPKALTLSEKASEYFLSIAYPELEYETLHQQVRILSLMKRDAQAKTLAQSLSSKYQYTGLKNLHQDLHQSLALINERQGFYSEALKHERLYHAYRDSLYNVELAGELADLRTKYESEKNARVLDKMSLEQELQTKVLARTKAQIMWLVIGLVLVVIASVIIWKLYKDRTRAATALEEKNLIIEDALMERELLLKEIHHRVKNNLQIVSSLLNIQAESDFSAQEVIKTSQDRIQAMAMIHEKLYQSEQLNSLNSKDYIENLIAQYKVSHMDSIVQPTFVTKLSEITLSLDKLIPIGLIINECITNTFKYAFLSQDHGEINISLQENSKQATLSISDNGSGFDANQKKVNLGMRLIEGLTKQLDGSLQMSSEKGTRYDISFPA